MFGPAKYSLGLIDWGQGGLERLDVDIRGVLASVQYRAHKGGKLHLYLGGRGLNSLVDQELLACFKLNNLLSTHLEWLLELFPNNR